MLQAPDPGEVEVREPDKEEPASDAVDQSADSTGGEVSDPAEDEVRGDDPNKAGIRVDLSGIGVS